MSQEYLFDKSIKRIRFLFILTGMNIESSKRSYLEVLRDRMIYFINFLWLNTDVLGEILWFIDGANHGKNFLELTYVAPCTTLCFLANLKSIYHLLNESRVNQLVDDMRRLESNINSEHDESITKRNDIVKTERRFLNIVISAINFWNLMTVIAFGTSPLILMYLKYSKTNSMDLMIPFFVVYCDPIDPYNIKYWPFVYLHQVWSACIVVLEIGAADCLLYTYCTYIKIQFRLLQHDFENLIPQRNGVLDSPCADVHTKMVRLINRHQEIILSVDLLEIIYSKSTLFNFVSSSVMICLAGFNATAIDDIAFVWSFVTFLSMSLLQIFLLCFFGDMIVRSSLEVSNAAYNCRWYLADENIRKKLLLVIIRKNCDRSDCLRILRYVEVTRGQKPCRLTASGYADVNLRAFTKILSTAWSYFALLKTVYRVTVK